MALYEELDKINVMRPLTQAGFKFKLDGKVHLEFILDANQPWIESRVDKQRKCSRWLFVYFKHLHLVPRGCRGCWKSYYVPKSLEELLEVYSFQQEQSESVVDIPCKCGIEKRFFTSRLGGYGAFWYNPLGCGLAEARQNTEKLSKALGKELLLKRGCTEMEQFTLRAMGLGSDKWDKLETKQNAMLEEMLDAVVAESEQPPDRTPEFMRVQIMQSWIEHAAEHGDKSYLKYTNGPMFPQLVQYKGSIHSFKDYPKVTYGTDNNECKEGQTDSGSGKQTIIQGLDQI